MMQFMVFLWLIGSMELAEEHSIYLSPIKAHLTTQSIHGKFNVFEDNLRDVLRSFGQMDTNDWSKVKPFLSDYFIQHFEWIIENEKIPVKFEVVEQTAEVFVIGFNATIDGSAEKITIKADFLMELFPMQKNILTIHGNDGQKAWAVHFLFDKSQTTKILSLVN